MLLKHTGQNDEVIRELAGFISSEVDRTNSLITRFLDFAREQSLVIDLRQRRIGDFVAGGAND